MTLSEKIVEDNDYYKFGYIQIEDVKEFIKEILKMNISKRHDKLIRELAGGELVEWMEN